MKKKVSMILLTVLTLCMSTLAGCAGLKVSYEATLKESFITSIYSGDVLVINLDVTNKTRQHMDAFGIVYDVAAKLDDVRLTQGFLMPEDAGFINNEKRIAPGEMETVQLVYELGAELDGEVTLLGITDTRNGKRRVESLNETFNLAEVEKKIVNSDYELTIDDVVKTYDGEGKDLLIIDMTFTNNSSEAISFSNAVDLQIFQNARQLSFSSLSYNYPSSNLYLEGNAYLNIQGDTSIQFRHVYELNDSVAPIEVKAVDWYSYAAMPLVEMEIQIQ